MKCVISLQNMCVEERTADELFSEVEGESDVVVGGGMNLMWCGLVRLTGANNHTGRVRVNSGVVRDYAIPRDRKRTQEN